MNIARNLIITLGLSVLSLGAFAQESGPIDKNVVLKGELGDCPKGRPCLYRVTKEDITVSRGTFLFSAKSSGLCNPQTIVINNNGKTVHTEKMIGSDTGLKRFPVRVHDLLSVTVIETQPPRVCVWAGTLNWQISRNPYSVQ